MFHLKCNNFNAVDAEIKKKNVLDRFWVCMYCPNNFATINDHNLCQTLFQSNNDYSASSNKACSILTSSKNLSNLFKEFINFSSQENKYIEYITNCKYYNIEEIQSFNDLNHEDAFI